MSEFKNISAAKFDGKKFRKENGLKPEEVSCIPNEDGKSFTVKTAKKVPKDALADCRITEEELAE